MFKHLKNLFYKFNSINPFPILANDSRSTFLKILTYNIPVNIWGWSFLTGWLAYNTYQKYYQKLSKIKILNLRIEDLIISEKRIDQNGKEIRGKKLMNLTGKVEKPINLTENKEIITCLVESKEGKFEGVADLIVSYVIKITP